MTGAPKQPAMVPPHSPPGFPQLCAYLTERSPQPFVAVEGITHVVRYANPAFYALVGQRAASLTGRRFSEAIPESAANTCCDLLDRAFHTGVHECLPEQPHGEIPGAFWSYWAWPILGEDGVPVGVIVQITDATEIAAFRRRMTATNEALVVTSVRQHEQTGRLTDELREAAHLAALGTFAAGIGHDLNNLILPMRMHLDVIEKESPDTRIRRDVAAIRASFNYLQRLAAALKLFAAGPNQSAGPETTCLPEWWADVRTFIRGILPTQIQLDEDFGLPDQPAVAAISPGALTQVVYNLVQNAGEALHESRTSAARITVAAARIPARGPPRVRITVSDNGPGMTPEVLRRCMEPFFSTKTRRMSTGMGLSIVRGLVGEASGRVEVRSEPGRGTSFTIDLPAVQPPDDAAAEPAPCRVAVTVLRPQMGAYLAWVGGDAGAKVSIHESAEPPDADLWIVQPRADLDATVRGFLLRGEQRQPPSDRRVLLYGDGAQANHPAGPAAANAPPSASGTTIAPGATVRDLRRSVEEAIRDCPRGSREV